MNPSEDGESANGAHEMSSWKTTASHPDQSGPVPLAEDTADLEEVAAAHHRAGQLLLALKAYDRLIELGRATGPTWCATGNALTDAGEYAQATAAYENSLVGQRQYRL